MISVRTKLALLVLSLAGYCTSLRVQGDNRQLPSKSPGKLISPDQADRPYGTNNATYGPVPKAEQLFDIEFLEIAPSPFLVYEEPPPPPANIISGKVTHLLTILQKRPSPLRLAPRRLLVRRSLCYRHRRRSGQSSAEDQPVCGVSEWPARRADNVHYPSEGDGLQ